MNLQHRIWVPVARTARLGASLRRIGRAAIVALYDELALEPKPGLVSFVDSGSHRDMTAQTFMRSLFALRHAFLALAEHGAAGAEFSVLEHEGIGAEARMLKATAGINTHRGAIFTLGCLCAAAGAVAAQGRPLGAAAIRGMLLDAWAAALAGRCQRSSVSHGACAARRYGLRSAGEEAALGFPVLFETTYPALQDALRGAMCARHARVNALFHTMAALDDTNLAYRGGIEGLRYAQQTARDFLRQGGSARADGLEHARSIHRDFVARHLSPGGSADVLAAACLLHRLCDGS